LEDLHAGICLLASEGDHVLVSADRRDDLLSLDDELHGPQLIAQGGRILEVQRVSGRRHPLLQIGDHLLAATLEEAGQPTDRGAILLLRHRADAGPRTELDVVVQAGTLVVAGDLPIAGQVRERLAQQVERPVDGRGGGEGAEVAAAVLFHAARDEHFGKRVGPGDLDVGVTFVVFEAHVVARAVLLDQVRLEDQRLQFRVGDDELQVGDVGHNRARLGILPCRRLEVGAHAAAQVHRFAHVDDSPAHVAHQIDARPARQGLDLGPNMLRNVHRSTNLPVYPPTERGGRSRSD
jgi:hypothetical protein